MRKIKKLENIIVELNSKINKIEKLTSELEKQNELKELELGIRNGNDKKLTGYPSKDMPWLKHFPKSSNNDKPNELTLYQQIRNSNKDNMNKNALSYNGEKITFRKLFHNIDKVAGALVSIGVKKGDVVTLCLPNVPEFVYSFYAINKIGAIASLIEPRTNADRIKKFVNNTNSKVMIMIDLCKKNIDKIIESSSLEIVVSLSAVESLENKYKKNLYCMAHKPVKTNGKYLNWNEFIRVKRLNNVEEAQYVKNASAVIVYTSGTTGIPKGAELTNETFNGQNMQLKYSGIHIKPGEIFLGNVPFFSAYGSSSGMHNALTNGVEIALIPKYAPKDFPDLLLKYRPNHVMGVPRFFELMLESKKASKNSFEFLDNIISGGDKMTPTNERDVNEFMKNHGAPNLKKGLGMSEFGGGFITTVSDKTNKIGSVGVPHVGNNVMIIDPETKKEVKYGKEKNVGELYVTGPTMMKSYFNDEEETKKFFYIDNNGTKWAKTGDLVYMDEDGVVFFVDRIKNAIMRPDGHTVHLLPIENAICKHPNVINCAVIGVSPDKNQTGELPMAFISLNKSSNINLETIQKEIEELCVLNIPERERPTWYRYIDSIPYNLGGKVDLNKLRKIAEKDDLKNIYIELQKED